MKKLSVLILVLLLLNLPISCENSGYKYSISELGINAGKVSLDRYPVLEPYDFLINTDTLNSQNLGMELFVKNIEKISEGFHFMNPLLNSAFADEPDPISVDKIALISIYSNDTLYASNNTYLPGSLLTTLFQASFLYSYEPMSILQFIEGAPSWKKNESLFFTFINPLEKPFKGTFEVTVTLEDGSIFDLETPTVLIK